jgi:hypothetical protein
MAANHMDLMAANHTDLMAANHTDLVAANHTDPEARKMATGRGNNNFLENKKYSYLRGFEFMFYFMRYPTDVFSVPTGLLPMVEAIFTYC